ncbi:hypothetical protein G3N30_10630 [Microbacterium lacticum]|uniref:hypothetical protein n=1 Tax=Microbacterium lacticum TaxID=33885 RepID=UPI0018B0D7B7|nr:hypothetical protein [Microbacterium lacticum]MBF9336651.1 hypothetical protein [Microbacterium lacticum]
MTGHTYTPELIAWVRRTTAAEGVAEHVDPDTVTQRLGALLDAPRSAEVRRL